MREISELNIERTYWSEIRLKIKEINPDFFKAVDNISPGEKYPLYLLKFPYESLIGDETSQFIPCKNNQLIRLNDPSLPSFLKSELGYGIKTSPVAMVLDKNLEWFIDIPKKYITIPIILQKPGDFFSYTKLLDLDIRSSYSPMGVLSVMSGARSVFMLPSIGCQNKLTKLCRELGIKSKNPQYLYEQFELFNNILNSSKVENNWQSTIIYFSEQWLTDIKTNPDWYLVQKYFYKIFAQKSLYHKNLPHYQTSYSLLLERTNQKPNPYLFDTFKHLLDVTAGEIPGFAPQLDNSSLPLYQIEDVFTNIYNLKNIAPRIMGPQYFEMHSSQDSPVYYSLQYPTTRVFSPNSKHSSTMSALKDVQDICKECMRELIKESYCCSNTIIQEIAKRVDLTFYHNSEDNEGVIEKIENLIDEDNRFLVCTKTKNVDLLPSIDSKFFRGCVRISHKKDS